jgi:hypothetical protein
VERNAVGGVKVKYYLPLGYITLRDQDLALNGIKLFNVVSIKYKLY